MKSLIYNGNIYIGLPPLYKVTYKDKDYYCYTDDELQAITVKMNKNYTLQRYKGLGEMNPDQLWDTTMNPRTRSMIKVTIEDAARADTIISSWMGDDVTPRKEYITKFANFNKVDNFTAIKKRLINTTTMR